MIKLKSLITEQAVIDQTKPFSLTDRDPYEYKLVNNVWYTKRKVDADWLDMKAKISPANYKIAVDRLNAFSLKPADDTNKPADDTNKPVVDKKPADDTKKPVKQDLGIKRDKLGYITSKKSAVYDKTFTLRTNMTNSSVVVLRKLDIDDIDRATGEIDHSFRDVVATLWPEDAKYYAIGDIKTIVMPDVRGTSGTEDKNNGREFTYLYIVYMRP